MLRSTFSSSIQGSFHAIPRRSTLSGTLSLERNLAKVLEAASSTPGFLEAFDVAAGAYDKGSREAAAAVAALQLVPGASAQISMRLHRYSAVISAGDTQLSALSSWTLPNLDAGPRSDHCSLNGMHAKVLNLQEAKRKLVA
eukprot:1160218-Pelagomonas_calceolata.AAC.14